MPIASLDLYRDCHLIVEGSPHEQGENVVRWAITGEKQETVEKASTALMRQISEPGSAAFTFPHRITDGTDPRCGWFRSTGFTSEAPNINAVKLLRKELGK